MRIVFMGTPGFAVASLEILVKNGYNVVGVVTAPDKPAGRGQQVQQSAVKEFALKHQLNILQPVNLKDESFLSALAALKADLQIVVAFRMLPEKVWNMPPLGTYNLHASLLPQYRGAAPINWALINGEKETGVTTFKLKHEIDTGDILQQQKVTITPEMTAGQLHDELMHACAALLLKTVKAIESGDFELREQGIPDDGIERSEGAHDIRKNIELSQIKHAPKIFKDDCRIDWTKNGEEIHNLIRGLSPYPCAWTVLEGTDKKLTFKIYQARFQPHLHNLKAGAIECDGKKELKVSCAGGFICIDELQMEGKKRMKTEEFLRGFNFAPGSFFG